VPDGCAYLPGGNKTVFGSFIAKEEYASGIQTLISLDKQKQPPYTSPHRKKSFIKKLQVVSFMGGEICRTAMALPRQ
jgi:hypothetical protein